MIRKITEFTISFLCAFWVAAVNAAAQPSVHVVELQEGQRKLVTLSPSNVHLNLDIQVGSQSFSIDSPALFHTPHYFLIKSAPGKNKYTFLLRKKYFQSPQLQYEFDVSDVARLESLPAHDALTLSALSIEQRAKLFEPMGCLGRTPRESLENQISLSALDALWKLERYNDLINHLKGSCINDTEALNVQTALARSYLALAYLEQSEFESSIAHFEALISWHKNQQGSSYSVRAMYDLSSHFGLAATIFAQITQSDSLQTRARNALEQAHQYFVNNGFEVSSVYSLAYLGTVFAMEQDFQQAISSFTLSNLSIDAIAPDLMEQKISNLNNLSITHLRAGKMFDAIKTMRDAINIAEGGSSKHSLSSIVINLGSLYLQLGDYDLGRKYYLSVKKFVEQHRSNYVKGKINDGLGVVALDTGDYVNAQDYLKKALKYFENDQGNSATIQIRLGHLHTLQGEYRQAAKYFKEAGKYFESEAIDSNNFSYYIRLAQLYGQQQNLTKVNSILQKIDIYLNTLPDVNGMPVGTKPLLLSQQLDYLDLKVDLFRLQGDVLQQRDHLEQLIQIIRAVSAGLDTARAGPVWADYTSRIVTKFNETLFQAYGRSGDDIWLEDLFTVLETHTAFSARRQRTMAQNIDTQKGEKNFLQTLYLSQVEQAEQDLFNAQDESQKMAAQLALNEARERFRLSSVSIDTAEFELPSVPTLIQTQNMLKPNEVVLRFFELGDSLHRYVISNEFWRVEEVGLTTTQARDLVSQLDPDRLNIRDKRLQKLAVLIPADIVANESFDKLIIVNSGPSHYVPYAALNMATQAKAYQPLMQRFSLVLPFHLGSYLLDDNATDDNTLDIMEPSITIFADPVFEVDAQTSVTEVIESNESKRSWLRNVTPLPATKEEARSIGKVLKSWDVNPLLNKDATNLALLSERSRSSTILHIASHGYFNQQTPDVIGVATSAVDSDGTPLSGFLSLRSMLAVPFTSKLIVISGCETGMGRELKGEGLVSLARGLIGQGAGGIISTLWEIPDRPTALFMRYFYEALLLKNGDVPAALAHAQSELMATGRYKSPRYWAGFTYTGGSRDDSVIAM